MILSNVESSGNISNKMLFLQLRIIVHERVVVRRNQLYDRKRIHSSVTRERRETRQKKDEKS